MSVSLAPTRSASATLPFLAQSTQIISDVDRRSRDFAQVILRTYPIADEVALAFKNPLSSQADSPRLQKLAGLLGELVNPRLLDQIIGASNRFDLQERYLLGISQCVEWLGSCEQLTQKPWLEVLVLQSLLPLYLTSSKENVITDVATSLCLMQKSACLVAWSRQLESHGACEWLHSRFVEGKNMEASLLNSFRISLPSVSNHYWASVGITVQSETNSPLHTAYGDIATQLTKRTTEIRIPTSFHLGNVSWEKILQHWGRLVAVLSESATSDKNQLPCIEQPVYGVVPENQIQTTRTESTSRFSANSPTARPKDKRLVEIRTATDPQLRNNLDKLLQKCRSEQSTLAMAVVNRLGQSRSMDPAEWHSVFIDALVEQSEASDLKGFVTEVGELALIFVDVDRSQLSHWIRESFATMNQHKAKSGMVSAEIDPLVAGISMVNAPTRAFRIDQLIDSAWRCMDGAAIQGAHAVKTIEVY